MKLLQEGHREAKNDLLVQNILDIRASLSAEMSK